MARGSAAGNALSCSLNNPQLGDFQSLNPNSQMFPQQEPQGVLARQGVPRFQAPQPFPHNSSPSPMACLFQNFQASVPESVLAPSTHMYTQSRMTSLPDASGGMPLPQFRDGLHEPQPQSMGPAKAGNEGKSVDAIYRAVVDAASKGVQVVITTTVSSVTQSRPVPTLSAMSAFTASAGGPGNPPPAVSAVIHGRRDPPFQEADPRPQPCQQQAQAGCPRKSSVQGKSAPNGGEAQDYFRFPGTPRRQWEGEAVPGTDGHHALWQGEEFLECSAHVRSSPRTENFNSPPPSLPRPAERPHTPLAPGDKTFPDDSYRFNNCQRTAVSVKERLEQTVERCAHMNGGHLSMGRVYGDALGPHRHDPASEDQSPSSSSTSLEGSLAKDYAHYNGHYNGCVPSPSDTKSLSSEEDLRHPDSPASNDFLHIRPRTFHMGELVWGQIKGFPPWHSKLVGEEQVHNPGLHNSEQGKVDPGKLRTLTEDLEALNRAAKRNIKGGKLNNHLEAAIHVTMSELDKMSGSVHQMPPRDRQVKPPKPKRRKISR